MGKRLITGIGALCIAICIIGLLTSIFITSDFVERYIDDDDHINEHMKIRISIFQQQTFLLSLIIGGIGVLVFLFRKQLLKFAEKRREMFLGILVLIIIFLVLFGIGEVLLRVVFAEQIYQEYGTGPGTAQFLSHIRYNSVGFRDVEHAFEKSTDTTRILIIGDSMTFGWGIEDLEDTFSRKTEAKLNAQSNAQYEVITLARPGFSTLEEVDVLKTAGLLYGPDIIVLAYYTNDAEGPGSVTGFEELFFHHYIVPYELGNLFYRNSYLYYFFESRSKNIARSLSPSATSYGDYILYLYTEKNPFFEKHNMLLEEFITIGRNSQSEVIVLLIPVLSDFTNYPYTHIDSHVTDIAQNSGAKTLTVLEEFTQEGAKNLSISFLDAHINEKGNDIIAQKLSSFILQMREKE